MFDSDSYHQGAMRIAANTAETALSAAHSSAFVAYGYDHPLTRAIAATQKALRDVHAELEKVL